MYENRVLENLCRDDRRALSDARFFLGLPTVQRVARIVYYLVSLEYGRMSRDEFRKSNAQTAYRKVRTRRDARRTLHP